MMKSVVFEPVWEQALLDGEKILFITKSKNYAHLDELNVKIKDEASTRNIGFTKIKRIQVKNGKDLENVKLADMTNFRIWLNFAHQYGIQDVYKFVEEIYRKLNPKRYEEFQMIQIYPVSKLPYNNSGRPKNGH